MKDPASSGTYEAYEHFDARENACVAWAGTLHGTRTGGYDVLLPGGQVHGEVHVNGSIDGSVELVPDDPSLPTYSGTYREKNNVIVTSPEQEGDDAVRVGQYRLRLPMTGTDGSTLVIRLTGRITVDATGKLVVAKDTFTCV